MVCNFDLLWLYIFLKSDKIKYYYKNDYSEAFFWAIDKQNKQTISWNKQI